MAASTAFSGDHQIIISGGNGIISPEDFKDYWLTLVGAFNILLVKENVRNGLWKDYPTVDQANQIKIKADRVFRSLEGLPEIGAERRLLFIGNINEELFDVINYANFGIRQMPDA